MIEIADHMLPWPAQAVIRLGIASLLGALIGIEREYHGRSAGFRTQMLVALGAALAMVVSLNFGKTSYESWPGFSVMRVDPARVAYGVMAGIGFLGAGTILHYGGGIRGLTTAASMWCTAAVGLASGCGMYVVAATATMLVVFALFVLSRLDRKIPALSPSTLTVTMPAAGGGANVARISQLLKDRGVAISNVEYERDYPANSETMTFYVILPAHIRPTSLVDLGDNLAGVVHLSVH